MPENHPDTRTAVFPARLRRWAFRLLLALSVVWGMFSAVVVFAVRYDLLPEAEPAGHVTGRGISLDEARDWPTLAGLDWRCVLSPDSVLSIARLDSALMHLLSVDGGQAPSTSSFLQFLWDPSTRGGVWVAHVAAPTCNCPYESAERWNYGRLVMNPNTGRVLARYLRPSIEAGEMSRLTQRGASTPLNERLPTKGR